MTAKGCATDCDHRPPYQGIALAAGYEHTPTFERHFDHAPRRFRMNHAAAATER